MEKCPAPEVVPSVRKAASLPEPRIIIYNVTWSTHNSKVSERMKKYRVKRGKPVLLELQEEIIVIKIIAEIIKEKEYKIHACNICKSHVHMIIESPENKISNTVRLLKGKSSQKYKEYLNIYPDEKFHLWGQKYNKWRIETPMQYYNTLSYIIKNRKKHGLPEDEELQAVVSNMANTVVDRKRLRLGSNEG